MGTTAARPTGAMTTKEVMEAVAKRRPNPFEGALFTTLAMMGPFPLQQVVRNDAGARRLTNNGSSTLPAIAAIVLIMPVVALLKIVKAAVAQTEAQLVPKMGAVQDAVVPMMRITLSIAAADEMMIDAANARRDRIIMISAAKTEDGTMKIRIANAVDRTTVKIPTARNVTLVIHLAATAVLPFLLQYSIFTKYQEIEKHFI